jgi:hypothetical protein
MRINTSLVPPAPKGKIMVIGRLGNGWAQAVFITNKAMRAIQPATRRLHLSKHMTVLLERKPLSGIGIIIKSHCAQHQYFCENTPIIYFDGKDAVDGTQKHPLFHDRSYLREHH